MSIVVYLWPIRRVLIVLQLEVLHKGDEVNEKIGDPQNLDPKTIQSAPTNGSTNSSTNGNIADRRPEPARANPVAPTRNFAANSSNLNDSVLDGRHSQPISSLTPYQNKWVIKARVTSKSTIRTWSNQKGEGKLFSMDLMDESGEIRCTGFREAVDKFYEMIEVDKVYYITKCLLKPANKQFTKIKNDYEMTMGNDTAIQECVDVSDIPAVQYEFVPIKNIQELESNVLIDVIGVCKESGDIQTFNARTTGRELKKRELTVVDQTNASVTLTLWGVDAENFNATYQQPVVLLKNARVSEFNGGKTITMGNGSTFKINPDIVEGHKLRGWFDNGGGENVSISVSARTGGGNFTSEWLTFQEAKAKGLGEGDRPDYFQLRGLIHLIRGNNAVYKACPQAECSKKVVDQENGQYRCEKCNCEYPNFKYRLMLSVSVYFHLNYLIICEFELKYRNQTCALSVYRLTRYRCKSNCFNFKNALSLNSDMKLLFYFINANLFYYYLL